MPQIDLPLDQLRSYRPEPSAQPDIEAFWRRTLDEAQRQPLNVALESIEYPADGMKVGRLYYDGWQGARICGWYLAREGASGQPTLIVYHGYSGDKGQVHDYLGWAYQGYTVLAVDVRGQGGESSDAATYPGGHATGWMTQGITSPDDYYYRGVYVDCVRALDAAASRPEVDADRIGLTGVSQGGGLTLAVAALDPRPKLAMPEVPFLCHYRRALEVTNQNPYHEIAVYLNRKPANYDVVFQTLSYFDNLNLADRITCPVLMTVGLQDLICPPSTIYAVFNRISSNKEMRVYPFGGHERFPTHVEHEYRWAKRYLKGG